MHPTRLLPVLLAFLLATPCFAGFADLFGMDEPEFLWKNSLKYGVKHVNLGEIVRERAGNPEVRDFGAHKARVHSELNDKIRNIAAEKNIDLPRRFEKHDRVKWLEKLADHEFDRKYLEYIIEHHESDIRKLRKQLDNDDRRIAAMAADVLEVLQRDRQTAMDLLSDLRRRGRI